MHYINLVKDRVKDWAMKLHYFISTRTKQVVLSAASSIFLISPLAVLGYGNSFAMAQAVDTNTTNDTT